MLVIITSVFLLAGAVKGVIGAGMPTVAMGLLGLLMPVPQAAALLVVPGVVANCWQAFVGPPWRTTVKRFATMMIGVCVGAPLGIGVLTSGANQITLAALGATLVIYSLLSLSKLKFTVSPRNERWLAPLIGIATGAITGATGMSAIPSAPYFNALNLSKDELIQALGLTFLVSTLALGVALAAKGRFGLGVATHSLYAVLPVVVGMAMGTAMRQRLSPELFRKCFFVGMLLIGSYMLIRALLR